MKRRLAKLVVFLLLGAIVNVAVGWVCAAGTVDAKPGGLQEFVRAARQDVEVMKFLSSSGEDRMLELIESDEWPGEERHGFGMRLRSVRWYDYTPDGLGVGRSQVGTDAAIPVNRSIRLVDRGWPLISTRGNRRVQGNEVVVETAITVNRKQPTAVGVPATTKVLLPYGPIWPGFAINTIFYAALLWLPTLGPFTARRSLRRKRGHCIKCGYDLRGAQHEVCPECGAGDDGV